MLQLPQKTEKGIGAIFSKSADLPCVTSLGVLCVYVAWIAFSPVTEAHDVKFAFGVLAAWKNALEAHDWAPTWSPLHANGFGSPVLFFYHKIFHVVAGTISVILDDIVVAMRITIILFTLLMLYGVRECARRVGMDKRQAFAMGVVAILSPYAIANWYERYAVAEYAAMALTPFVAGWALDFEHRRASIGARLPLLLLLLFLLALAHLAVFLVVISLLLLGAAPLERRFFFNLRLFAVHN